MKRIAILAAAIFALSACGGGTNVKDTVARHEATARLAVQYGVIKYCGRAPTEIAKAERCAHVARIATDVQAIASGEAVTIPSLRAAVLAQLPANLDAADRFLAVGLLDVVVAELTGRLGDGVLNPDQLVVVGTVVGWIIEGAGYFPPV